MSNLKIEIANELYNRVKNIELYKQWKDFFTSKDICNLKYYKESIHKPTKETDINLKQNIYSSSFVELPVVIADHTDYNIPFDWFGVPDLQALIDYLEYVERYINKDFIEKLSKIDYNKLNPQVIYDGMHFERDRDFID